MFTFYVVVITNIRQIESYLAIRLNNVHNLSNITKNTFHHNSCFVLGDFSFNIKFDAIHPLHYIVFLPSGILTNIHIPFYNKDILVTSID